MAGSIPGDHVAHRLGHYVHVYVINSPSTPPFPSNVRIAPVACGMRTGTVRLGMDRARPTEFEKGIASHTPNR